MRAPAACAEACTRTYPCRALAGDASRQDLRLYPAAFQHKSLLQDPGFAPATTEQMAQARRRRRMMLRIMAVGRRAIRTLVETGSKDASTRAAFGQDGRA